MTRKQTNRAKDSDAKPADSGVYRDIMNAAEEVFAEHGYSGSSLRNIGAKANVTAAMIVYYFGSKKGLFEEIFIARGNILNAERIRMLDALENSDKNPKIHDILKAFLFPIFDLHRSGAGGVTFLQLHARLQNDPATWVSDELRGIVYNTTMRRFADAMVKALPGCDLKSIFWRIAFSTGVIAYANSGSTRVEEISDGLCNSNDLDQMFNEALDFCIGGFVAPNR